MFAETRNTTNFATVLLNELNISEIIWKIFQSESYHMD